ncbi:MAG: flippase [Candidatus Eisenbacteria bacterium]|nr:flippase [Candidatus Eisenbacteria bacterium]
MSESGKSSARGRALRDISRGSFLLGIDQGLNVFFGIIYSVVVLRYLGPEKFGMLSLSLSVVGIATIGTANFEAFLERYVAEFKAEGKDGLIVRAHLLIMLLKISLSLIVSGLLFLLAGPISHSYGMPLMKVLLPIVTLTLILEALSAANRATLYGLQRFGSMVIASGISNSVKVLLLLPVIKSGSGVIGVAWVVVSALVISAGLYFGLLWAVLRNLRKKGEAMVGSGGLLRMIFKYCIPLLGARAAYLAGQNLSRIILGYLLTPHSLGLFSFAFNIIERFIALGQAVPQAILPSLARLKGEGDEKGLFSVFSHSHRAISVLASLMSAGIFVFAREITLIMGGREYLDGVLLLRILAFVPLARTAQQPLTMLFYALEKTKTVLWLALLKLFLEASLYILFVPFTGLIGAGFANLVSVFVTFVQAVVLAGRAVPAGIKESAGGRLAKISVLTSLQCALIAALSVPFEFLQLNAAIISLKVVLFPLVFFGCTFALGLFSKDDVTFFMTSISGRKIPLRPARGLSKPGESR